MNSINPQALKKLLLSLAFSILIILAFLVLKVFFHEDKQVELKNFKTPAKEPIKKAQKEEQTPQKNKYLLLPTK